MREVARVAEIDAVDPPAQDKHRAAVGDEQDILAGVAVPQPADCRDDTLLDGPVVRRPRRLPAAARSGPQSASRWLRGT